MNNPLNAIWSSLSSAAKWTAGRVSQPGIARNAAIGTGIVAGAGIAGGVGNAYKNWAYGGNRTRPDPPGSAPPSASLERALFSVPVLLPSVSNPTFNLWKVSASWDLPSPFPTRLPAVRT